MSFGGAGPAGAASLGEVEDAYLSGMSLGPAEDSFGGGSGLGVDAFVSSSYMSRMSNVDSSGRAGLSGLCGLIGVDLVSFPFMGGIILLFARTSSSGIPGDLPPETTTSLIGSLLRDPLSPRAYFS